MRNFVSTIVVASLVTCQLLAQERRQRPKPQIPARVFTMPGITFTEEQQEKIEELKKKYGPLLIENQQKWNKVLTEEQRIAKREAFTAAREAGKDARDREVRAAADEAAKVTQEQKKQQTAIQKERSELQRKILDEIIALLTREQRASLRRPQRKPNTRQPKIAPTYPDLKYGSYDRNVMDVWLAESKKPTPVLVSIHGGGFRGGNKKISPDLLKQCLDSGISCVAITYRLTDEAIAPAQMLDSARAIQFIRYNSKAWKIDPTRIAATGGSAGAGISLWLGFHDDLADPNNEDPVLRESTRLTCMFVNGGQSSYDPRFIREMFPNADTYKIEPLVLLFDADLDKLDDLPKEKYELFEEVSAIPHLTKDDAPAILSYGRALDSKPDIHHPLFGKLLKEKMDELGIRCEVYAGDEVLGGGGRLSTIEFIKQEFGLE